MAGTTANASRRSSAGDRRTSSKPVTINEFQPEPDNSLVYPGFFGVGILGSCVTLMRSSGMGRRGYPPEFRRKVLDLVGAAREIADVARDLDLSDQTIYTWRRQDCIDRGLEAGLTSAEKAELMAAKQRIAQLEAELAVHRRATELWRGRCAQKPSTPRSRRWLRKGCRSGSPAGCSGSRNPVSTTGVHARRRSGRFVMPG